jgi:20S proteasome alpha/beta subunit
MDALKSFEPALKSGELHVQPSVLDSTLLIHADNPTGSDPRLTYAKMRGASVGALVIFTGNGMEKGVPVFQVGYAVPQHLRKRGLAKEALRLALEDFRQAMADNGVPEFYVEAMVSEKNIGSQKVAADVIGGEPLQSADRESGEPCWRYERLITSS